MADILMCMDSTCRKRNKCYRYRKIPEKYGQEYGTFMVTEDGHCDGFWDCTEYVEKNLTKKDRPNPWEPNDF